MALMKEIPHIVGIEMQIFTSRFNTSHSSIGIGLEMQDWSQRSCCSALRVCGKITALFTNSLAADC